MDDMLVMAQTLKEISQAKETLINFKKSQLTPMKEIKFLGLVINSVKMTLALPLEKVLDIQNKCMQFIASSKTPIMELTKLLGKLSFTAQAVLPGRIQCRYLQQQQIQAVRETNSYQTKIQLSLVISGKDKAYQSTGARCSENCNIDLYQRKIGNSNPLTNRQCDSSVLLGKNGGTRSQELLQVAKEIWDYLLANRIAVTAEYLPRSLNIQADWQSRNHRDSSDWKLNPKIFSQIVRGIPQIDLFASQLNHQLPKYMSWHPVPGSCVVDTLQHSWKNLYSMHSLHFA